MIAFPNRCNVHLYKADGVNAPGIPSVDWISPSAACKLIFANSTLVICYNDGCVQRLTESRSLSEQVAEREKLPLKGRNREQEQTHVGGVSPLVTINIGWLIYYSLFRSVNL